MRVHESISIEAGGSPGSRGSAREREVLLVLLEEELLAIELSTAGWPVLQAPYLSALNSSAVTVVAHAQVNERLWTAMQLVAQTQRGPPQYSNLVCSHSPTTTHPLLSFFYYSSNGFSSALLLPFYIYIFSSLFILNVKTWPITGGRVLKASNEVNRELLITGYLEEF